MYRKYIVFLWFFILLYLGSSEVFLQGNILDQLRTCNFTERGADIEGLRLGVVVVNLETGSGCVENQFLSFPVASVNKIFVAGAFYEQVAQRNITFDDTVIFAENYLMNGNTSCLREENVGETFTLGFLSDLMISCSDNAATWIIYDLIGAQAVQDYINRTGIVGIGETIPYSEVDRLKLTFLDERWQDVPAHLASQFYRRRTTDGLVPQYFEEVPRLTRNDLLQANADYFSTYSYNTATPRALTNFILKLSEDLKGGNTIDAQVAWWLLNTMMLTQRQFSVQAIPGTVFVADKNGWDVGLTAELSVLFSDLSDRSPEGLVIVVAQQSDLTAPNIQTPSEKPGVLDDFLLEISPRITQILYPTANVSEQPSANLEFVTYGNVQDLRTCWEEYQETNFTVEFLNDLETCWQPIPRSSTITLGNTLATGLIFRDLDFFDTRLTLIYTAPDGRQFSYQTQQFERDAWGVYWLHTPDVIGFWEVEIYYNLRKIYTYFVLVE